MKAVRVDPQAFKSFLTRKYNMPGVRFGGRLGLFVEISFQLTQGIQEYLSG